MVMIGIPARTIPAIASSTDRRGFVYALEFASGVTKIGCSTVPAQRLRNLIEPVEPFGIRPVRAWLTPKHANYTENEHRILSYARGFSARTIREYFIDLDIERIVKYAGALTYLDSEPVSLETHCDAGHELEGDNLVRIHRGGERRGCRACGDRHEPTRIKGRTAILAA